MFCNFQSFKVLIFLYDKLTNFKLYIYIYIYIYIYTLLSFSMLDLAREMKYYLLSVGYSPLIFLFFIWFGRGLKCKVVILEV